MSYTYLLEQGEVSSAECFSDIPVSVLLKLNLTPEPFCFNGNETESCPSSQFGTTSAPLTEPRGEARLTSCVEGSRAKTSVQPERAKESTENGLDCGPRWPGSFARYNPSTHSWRTAQCSLFGGLTEFSETWPRWGMMQDGECLELVTPVRFTNAKEYGYWPTPMKNVAGKSPKTLAMVEDGKCQMTLDRALAIRGDGVGLPNPEWVEWLMGWPMGWTDMRHLETAKFRQWLRSHSKYCQEAQND